MTDKPASEETSIETSKPITDVGRTRFSADWFMRGILTRVGDTLDRFTGRKWTPSSSIATSELVERLKSLLAAEAKEVQGKGTVVPHNIKLKMQWDKFSTDSEQTIERVQNELMVAAADFINDNLYYTLAPLNLEIKSDYFTEGVKLYASFGEFREEQGDAELNVTMPAITLEAAGISLEQPPAAAFQLIASFNADGRSIEKRLAVTPGKHISIGRLGGNELIINDPSISKTHASLVVDQDGNMTVADTASTNGTFVNGERIAYGKAVPITVGDKLKVGTVEVLLDLTRQSGLVEEEEAAAEALITSADGPELMIRTAQIDEDETSGSESGVETLNGTGVAPAKKDEPQPEQASDTEAATKVESEVLTAAAPDGDKTIESTEESAVNE